MIAVDTNILLRLIVGDDEIQFAEAQHLFAGEQVYLLPTVVMETEWVLRSRYKFDRGRVVDALSAIFALPSVSVERREAILWALDRYRTKGDFADLIHLACAPLGVTAFATFDEDVAGHAGLNVPISIRPPVKP